MLLVKNPTHIFLWSYMRPKLTHLAIHRALSYSNLSKLVVIIDGLRIAANDREKILRQNTISTVEEIALHDNRIELWVYGKNLENNTEHIFRTHKRGLDCSENGIWVEEDMDVDYEEFARLVSDNYNNADPFVISGASHGNHPNSNIPVRNSLFGNFWLHSLNTKAVELVESTFRSKVFNESLVKERLASVLGNNSLRDKTYLVLLERFWVEKMESGLRSNFRWDSLAQYAFIKKGIAPLVSNQNLVRDLSYLSSDSMNPREKVFHYPSHELKPSITKGNLFFCINCERAQSRKGKSVSEIVFNSCKWRLNSIRQNVLRRDAKIRSI